MAVNKSRQFIKGFIIGFAVMISITILIIPGILWTMGIWPVWTLLSYFIIIPTISGAFVAWLDLIKEEF